MNPHTIPLAALCLILGGCASMSPPQNAELERLPVVAYGDPVPADGDFILHFPAGVAIDTPVTFEGNLFQQAATARLAVKPAKDIYVHKQWMSYDRQHWVDANDRIEFKVEVVVPGYTHPEPGYVRLEMNAKP